MARGGIYRSEVEAARERLLKVGRNPSIDAIRVELGNTGSKTTIHRILKEIENSREEASRPPLNEEALASSIQQLTRTLAETLRSEAETQIREQQEVSSLAVNEASTRALQAEAFAHQQAVQAREAAGHLAAQTTRLHELEQLLASKASELTHRDMRIEALESVLAERERHVGVLSQESAAMRTRIDAMARDAETLRSVAAEQTKETEALHARAVMELQSKHDRLTAAAAAAEAVTQEQAKILLDYQQRLNVVTAELSAASARNEKIIEAAASVPSLEARLVDAMSLVATLRDSLAEERTMLKRIVNARVPVNRGTGVRGPSGQRSKHPGEK
jgi:predicted RNase H-like nuclease (RuvC/YqgF family)